MDLSTTGGAARNNKNKIRNVVVYVLIAAAVLTGYMAWKIMADRKTALLPPGDMEISEYAIGAEVISVTGNSIYVKAGMVFTDGRGRTSFDYKNMTIMVTDGTAIHPDGSSSSKFLLANLKPGHQISFYTRQNPYTSDNVTVHRITVY